MSLNSTTRPVAVFNNGTKYHWTVGRIQPCNNSAGDTNSCCTLALSWACLSADCSVAPLSLSQSPTCPASRVKVAFDCAQVVSQFSTSAKGNFHMSTGSAPKTLQKLILASRLICFPFAKSRRRVSTSKSRSPNARFRFCQQCNNVAPCEWEPQWQPVERSKKSLFQYMFCLRQ